MSPLTQILTAPRTLYLMRGCSVASVSSNLKAMLCDLWTVARQAPLSVGLSRQKYWCGFQCSPPGDLPNPGIEPKSPASPALQAEPPGKPLLYMIDAQKLLVERMNTILTMVWKPFHSSFISHDSASIHLVPVFITTPNCVPAVSMWRDDPPLPSTWQPPLPTQNPLLTLLVSLVPLWQWSPLHRTILLFSSKIVRDSKKYEWDKRSVP